MKLYQDDNGIFWIGTNSFVAGTYQINVNPDTGKVSLIPFDTENKNLKAYYDCDVTYFTDSDGSSYSTVTALKAGVGDFFVKASGSGSIDDVAISDVSGLSSKLSDIEDDLDAKADLVDGIVPVSQLPDSLTSGLQYQGSFDAENDTVPTASEDNSGYLWIVTVAGTKTIESVSTTLAIGDWLISNGSEIEVVSNSTAIATSDTYGTIKLAGDIGGTALVPRVTGIKGWSISNTPTETGLILMSSDIDEDILTWDSLDVFTGATSESDGEAGQVPAPTASQISSTLHGDGTWRKPYSSLSQDSEGNMIFTDDIGTATDTVNAAYIQSIYIGDDNDNIVDLLEDKADLVDGTVPLSELPDSVVSGLKLIGIFDPTSDTLETEDLESGMFYKVSAAGTVTIDSTDYSVSIGDWIIYDGTTWDIVESTVDVATTTTVGLIILDGDLDGTYDEVKVTGLGNQKWTLDSTYAIVPSESYDIGTTTDPVSTVYTKSLTIIDEEDNTTATIKSEVSDDNLSYNLIFDYEGAEFNIINASTTMVSLSATETTMHTDVIPDADNTIDLGSSDYAFADAYVTSLTVKGDSDLAGIILGDATPVDTDLTLYQTDGTLYWGDTALGSSDASLGTGWSNNDGTLLPAADNTYNIGTVAKSVNALYANKIALSDDDSDSTAIFVAGTTSGTSELYGYNGATMKVGTMDDSTLYGVEFDTDGTADFDAGATFGDNVGIGNTSPSYKLDVSGTGRFTSTLRVNNTTNPYLYLTSSGSDDTNGLSAIYFGDGSDSAEGWVRYYNGSDYEYMILGADNANKVWISSSGMSIGSYDTSYTLYVGGTGYFSSDLYAKGYFVPQTWSIDSNSGAMRISDNYVMFWGRTTTSSDGDVSVTYGDYTFSYRPVLQFTEVNSSNNTQPVVQSYGTSGFTYNRNDSNNGTSYLNWIAIGKCTAY